MSFSRELTLEVVSFVTFKAQKTSKFTITGTTCSIDEIMIGEINDISMDKRLTLSGKGRRRVAHDMTRESVEEMESSREWTGKMILNAYLKKSRVMMRS